MCIVCDWYTDWYSILGHSLEVATEGHCHTWVSTSAIEELTIFHRLRLYQDPPTLGVSWLNYPTLRAYIGFQTGHPSVSGRTNDAFFQHWCARAGSNRCAMKGFSGVAGEHHVWANSNAGMLVMLPLSGSLF